MIEIDGVPDERAPCTYPFECSSSIFQFLDLGDVLRFGSASKACLNDSVFEIQQRRKRMTQQYAYRRDWKIIGGPGITKIMLRDQVPIGEEPIWIPIPSVRDRVKQLSFAIPYEHPLQPLVQLLDQELESGKNLPSDELPSRHSSYVGNCTGFIERLRSASRAHKLHAEILSKAMSSNPIKDEHTVHSNPHEQEQTCTLTRYVGTSTHPLFSYF